MLRWGSRERCGAAGKSLARAVGLFLFVLLGLQRLAAAQTVRVVAYNIEADVSGVTTPRDGLYTVLEAIGENYVNGAAHPLDILALEETTSNAVTVAPIVSALNSYYGGSAVYAMSGYQGKESGNSPSSGNGPNALVYNRSTLTLLESVGVGTPTGSGNGEYRQVTRYAFLPVGGVSGTKFYVYVSHMKSSYSGDDATNQGYRAAEAQLIRTDMASLPANGGVLCLGDFNLDGSTEAAYQTLTTTGAGQVTDPLNPSLNYNETWNSSTYLTWLSDSSTGFRYRDDIQFMSPAVYSGTGSVGLHYVAGSCVSFGNNGSVPFGKSVALATNTALNGLQGPITPATARTALSTGSDHLPVVADYTVASLTPYGTWQSAHFTSAELANSAVSGDNADPDGDGVVNLLEYALNLNPRSAGVAGLPAVGTTTVGGSRYLTLAYTRVIAATDITYVPQVSGDLIAWSSAVTTVSVTNNADGVTQTVVVRDSTPTTGAGARFLRLMVTRP